MVIQPKTADWTHEDHRRRRDSGAAHQLTAGAEGVYVKGESRVCGARTPKPVFKGGRSRTIPCVVHNPDSPEKLEDGSAAAPYLNSLYSYEYKFRATSASARGAGELEWADDDFDISGRSSAYHPPVQHSSGVTTRADDSARYDDSIRGHLQAANRGSGQLVVMR